MRERNKLLEGKELVLYLVKRFNYTIEQALEEVEKRKLIDQNELDDLKFIMHCCNDGPITNGDKKLIEMIEKKV